MDNTKKEDVKRALIVGGIIVIFGLAISIAYRCGCQKGVDTIHDVILQRDPELFKEVDKLFIDGKVS